MNIYHQLQIIHLIIKKNILFNTKYLEQIEIKA